MRTAVALLLLLPTASAALFEPHPLRPECLPSAIFAPAAAASMEAQLAALGVGAAPATGPAARSTPAGGTPRRRCRGDGFAAAPPRPAGGPAVSTCDGASPWAAQGRPAGARGGAAGTRLEARLASRFAPAETLGDGDFPRWLLGERLAMVERLAQANAIRFDNQRKGSSVAARARKAIERQLQTLADEEEVNHAASARNRRGRGRGVGGATMTLIRTRSPTLPVLR